MRQSTVLLSGLLFCATSACGPVVLQHRVSQDALASVPEEAQAEIAKAELALEEAVKARDAAALATTDVKYSLTLAEAELSNAEHRLDTISDIEAVVVAQEDTAKISQIGELRTAVAALRDALDQEVTWRKLDHTHTERQFELAEAKLLTADANLETAKAEAVQTGNSPLKESTRVSDYRLQGATMLGRVPPREASAAEVWADVEQARTLYEQLRDAVPPSAAANYQALRDREDKAKKLAADLETTNGDMTKLKDENIALNTDNKGLRLQITALNIEVDTLKATTKALVSAVPGGEAAQAAAEAKVAPDPNASADPQADAKHDHDKNKPDGEAKAEPADKKPAEPAPKKK